MRYRIITYGCQMNDRDSEAIAATLHELGLEPASAGEPPELVIFNTCCIRETAERKIIGKILELRLVKEQQPSLLVGVGGCLTQQPGTAEALARRAPWLDFIFGTHNLARLPVLVAMARARAKLRAETGDRPAGPVIEVWPEPKGPLADQPRPQTDGAVTAHVSVSFGCNNYCSYCIVPHVRGRERSRQPDAVVSEVVDLARTGVREVTLLGQNVNSYGHDLPGEIDFARLLTMVDAAAAPEGLLRIRFMTSHPKDLSPALISAMAELPTVCEHIHLPVQSGSDEILRRMNRRYTRSHYLELVRALRAAMPGVGLTTDIITGFPGETERDFEDTLDLVRTAAFDGAFTFAYSRRSGTSAADLPDQVPYDVKRRRLAALNRLQEQISRERLARLVGTVHEVLFLGPSEKDQAVLGGRTRSFHYVLVPGDAALTGQALPVRITDARTWTLSGELLGGSSR